MSMAQVDRVVLVNPATSFADSLWPALGPLLPQVPKVRPPTLGAQLSNLMCVCVTRHPGGHHYSHAYLGGESPSVLHACMCALKAPLMCLHGPTDILGLCNVHRSSTLLYL